MPTTPRLAPTGSPRTDRREMAGRLLLGVCAVAALGAVASAVPAVAEANDATRLVETWRMTGLAVFAGIFALLARNPRSLPGVFELVIAHKAAMTLVAVIGAGSDGATEIAVADGTLTIALAAAYALTRAWLAWRRSWDLDG